MGLMRNMPWFVASASGPASHKSASRRPCTGTDDDVKINEALAELGTGGGVVQFGPGTFTISQPIDMDLCERLQLLGSNLGGTFIQLATNANCHMVKCTTHPLFHRISGIHFDGRSAFQNKVTSFPYDMCDGVHYECPADDTGTNLTVDGANAANVVPDAHTVVAGDVGKIVRITGGTGFTVGEYYISAQDGTSWTLLAEKYAATNCAAVGTAGGTWSLIGATSGAYDIQIDNCWWQYCKGHGIAMREGWGGHIGERTIVEYCEGHCIYLMPKPLARVDYSLSITNGKYLCFQDSGGTYADGLGDAIYVGPGHYNAHITGNQLRSDVASRCGLRLVGDSVAAMRQSGSGKHSVIGNDFMAVTGQASKAHIIIDACGYNRILGNHFTSVPGNPPNGINGIDIPVTSYAAYNEIDDNVFVMVNTGDVPINALQGRQNIGHSNLGYKNICQAYWDVPHDNGNLRTITGTHTLFGASGATAPTIPGGSFVVVRVTPNNAAAAAMQWYGVVDGAKLIVGTSADMGEVSGDAVTVTPSAFSGLHFWITGSAGTPWVAGDVGKWIRVFQGATVRGTWRIEELGDAGGGAGSKIKVYGQAAPVDWTGGETYVNLTAYLLSVEVAFTNQDRDIVPDGVTVRFPQVLT